MNSNIIGWIITILIFVGGLIFASNQNKKAIKAAAEVNNKSIKAAAESNSQAVKDAANAAAIAATKELIQVIDTVKSLNDNFKNLACVKDTGYMMETGKLMQKVDSLKESQDRLQDKLDTFLLQMKGKC